MSPIAGQQPLFPASLEARLRGSLGRAGGFLLCAAFLGLWLSAISWSSTDPSLTHATGDPAQNWLGPFGAVVSDLLLETVGLATIVVLTVPVFWAFELISAERVAGAGAKMAYYPLSVVLFAGCLSALPIAQSWPIGHGYGGILGDAMLNFLATGFGFINPDRAAAASGLAFFVAGLSTLAQAIGISRSDIGTLFSGSGALYANTSRGVRAMAERGSFMARFGPELIGDYASALPELAPSMERRGPSRRESLGARVPAEPRLRGWDDQDYEPDIQPLRADTGPLSADAGFEIDPYLGEERFDLEGHDFSSRAIAARFAPARVATAQVEAPGPAAGPISLEPEFDALTDSASRAIAARFAPHGSRPAIPAVAPPEAPVRPSLKAQLLGGVGLRKQEAVFKRPPVSLLARSASTKPTPALSQTVMRGNARLLEDVLADFGVKCEVRDIKSGPVVTLYEVEPARGTKTSRIVALADDIARSMNVRSVRIAVVPGRNAIGIELPNSRRDAFSLREILEADAWKAADGALPIALGKSITGEAVVADLARMPHLLIAGTTGSGKSVGLNAMIVSLLMRHSPEECRLLMIDPKMLELSVYNGIPHLLSPVVTEPQKAVAVLNWAVGEMEERYKRMALAGARNIEAFNGRVRAASNRGESIARTVQTGFDPHTGQALYEREEIKLEQMPYIVVVVDEFADLMIAAGKEIEIAVQRLAQKARAAGIHLIMATQRPSVDIITGTIKANFPTRISFKVASKIDSRTILNEQGAEQLLGHGDMLFASGAGQMARIHGALVGDEEVESVVQYLRGQGGPRYIDGLTDSVSAAGGPARGGPGQSGEDSLYDKAVAIVLCDKKASTSYLQRRLSIGYNRAADLIERMEDAGLISAPNHTGRREILAGEGMAAKKSA